jgi:hypothetical protein
VRAGAEDQSRDKLRDHVERYPAPRVCGLGTQSQMWFVELHMGLAQVVSEAGVQATCGRRLESAKPEV